ncbi:MAG: DNA methylase [Candidatus Aenigmatarchaeota archaeon]|nr:MAG: DNA methylase [Candidatus Aenigmarchaeota archaeon]
MSDTLNDKRLIEVDFPLKEVSEESVREKNIRHGHISTLHIWWARRPLAASRATTYAALVPAPKDEKELREKLKFIAELSKWENSLNEKLIEKARQDIRDFFGGRAPKVLDCFAGGGSIPLEALRLGCETYALEYNPVAVLILKAVLEYPQKYGKKLIEDVKKWGQWVYEEAKKEIGRFYPEETIPTQKSLSEEGGEKYIPVGYIWARTIKCQNPSCQAEIPLMKQFWLAKKENRKIALKMVVDKEKKKIDFKIVRDKEIYFDPSRGTVRKATVQCPICGAGISDKNVRKEGREGRISQRLIAVILHSSNRKGKEYRVANSEDVRVYNCAEKYLEDKVNDCKLKWEIDPLPNENLPPKETLGFRIQRYGMLKWSDLFNSRQKLALLTFTEKVRLAYSKMVNEGYEKEYAKIITVYLALCVSKFATTCNTICRWNDNSESIAGKPDQAPTLEMRWDYPECNPFSSLTGSFVNHLETILEINLYLGEKIGNVKQSSATKVAFPDNFFDAVITDPPYYDHIAYCDLSDFFYVWLKRMIGDLYFDLFSTPLTPKSQEIVADPSKHGNNFEKAKKFFERMITQSFQEIYRVLKTNGIAIIVFAYKSTEAWEVIINSLLTSGLVLIASWPIHTERVARLRAKESAALASSVYMVCRKRTKENVAYFNEIKEKIEQRVREKLEQFWKQGISGADFFVSAIGPAVEVFGQYSRVEKLSGEEVSVKELLEYVRKVVSEFALERVLKHADLGGIDSITRFYLLWRWTFGNAKVLFDDAIKLSRPMGVEITELWDKGGLVKKEKEFVRVLNPKDRAQDQTFLKKTKFTSMIDVLHYVLILWERGEKEKIKEILDQTGYATSEAFWQTAQALSEILPEGDKEKQMLQGFLYGKEDYIREFKGKRTLFEFIEER